ncbi:Retrovirus-related Pol polyprotein from transposon 17.6 [Dictyocoela muelleri]|nr:Retrovirus-related Pol polyprotein from transposon 17.6 [Dictyocoela muelleri]
MISNFKLRKPKTKKHVQKLLGFLNYFKAFIPNFSNKTLYLTELFRNESKTKWCDEYNDMTDKTINQIKNAPILKYPDPKLKFTLETDASDLAIGSILEQKDNLIAFYSHKFTTSESKYTTMEK